MQDRIKRLFHSAASRNGSYSIGAIVLVIVIVIVVNLIAGQLPEKVKRIDISDNRIYEISDKRGNYYYIFPELDASSGLTEGMSSDMVMLVNAHGMNMADPVRDTITTTPFMTTSSDGYAVTEENQKQGAYTLGAVATETVGDEEARFTVISAGTLIDSQVTDAFSTLENLTLFSNAVAANYDDMENVAIEPKSLEVTYNTMQHAGVIKHCRHIRHPARNTHIRLPALAEKTESLGRQKR